MIIRASEIGVYIYCQRAWWYRKQGAIPDNLNELADGSRQHQKHGQAVFIAQLMRLAGYGLLLTVVILTTIYLMR